MSSYPTYELLLDPTTFILVFVVLCTLYIGTEYHLYFQAHILQFQASLSQNTETALTTSSNDLKLITALLLPIFGSVFLLLLFYFLNIFQYFLIIIFSCSSFFALNFALHPIINSPKIIPSSILQAKISIPVPSFISSEPLSVSIPNLVLILYSLFLTILWLVTKYWVLTDFIALNLAMTSLSFIRLPNLKISLTLLSLFFFYDIFWVFLSPLFFGKNVMVTVALSLPSLPILILLPRTLLPGYSILGLGDIILPGLYICFLTRFDDENKKNSRYRQVGMWGYGIGVVVTLVSLVVMKTAQPALLWLVPGVMISSIIEGYRRGELKQLWEGGKENRGERGIGVERTEREEEMVEMGFVERGDGLGTLEDSGFEPRFVLDDEESDTSSSTSSSSGNKDKGKEVDIV